MALNHLIESIEIYQAKPVNYVVIHGYAITDEGIAPNIEYVQNGIVEKVIYTPIVRNDVIKNMNRPELISMGIACGFSIVRKNNDVFLDTIELNAVSEGKTECILALGKNEISKYINKHSIMWTTDIFRYAKETNICEVSGWAHSIKNEALNYEVYDSRGNKCDTSYHVILRNDVATKGLVDEEQKFCGYQVRFKANPKDKYTFVISSQSDKVSVDFEPLVAAHEAGALQSLLSNINFKTLKKAYLYFQRNGFKETIARLKKGYKPQTEYDNWFRGHRVTDLELSEQKYHVFSYKPLISIIVPTFNTPLDLLAEMVDSVKNQSYQNWELCLADASSPDSPTRKQLLKYSEEDSRIKVNFLDCNYGISGNTNKALDIATGDYTGLLDHDDFLEPDALFEIVKALNEYPYDSLYTDEDKYEMGSGKFADPNFKPDFAIDALRSHNYITHFFVAKTSLIREVGGEHSEFDGSQDYDLIFRCTEKSNKVCHIAKILYHWRIHPGSTAGDPEQKMYCYEAGRKAIQAHLDRMGISGSVTMLGKPYWGLYHVKYNVIDNPLVSIIIPNYENKKVLEKCINSLFSVNTYKNIEIIIVENNSKSEEIFEYYKELQNNHKNVNVVTWEGGEFNYSSINNYGVKFANGDYLLLLNNDTEMIEPTSIEEMLGICMREDVGAVGAKLLYGDDTVQHAGVVIGFGGVAGHVFSRILKNDTGYMMRALLNFNYSAVTGACLMTKKSLYEQVGGLDENLKVSFNDVDYCLKLRELDKLIVYNAFSLWHHYESVSRGYESDPVKIRRYDSEVKLFQERWHDILMNGDPYYNKNFDVNYTPFEVH